MLTLSKINSNIETNIFPGRIFFIEIKFVMKMILIYAETQQNNTIQLPKLRKPILIKS